MDSQCHVYVRRFLITSINFPLKHMTEMTVGKEVTSSKSKDLIDHLISLLPDHQTLPSKMFRALFFLTIVLPAYSHLFSSCMSKDHTMGSSDGPFFYIRADIKSVTKEDQLTIAAYSGLLARGGGKLALIGKANDKVWLDTMLEEVRICL